MTGQCSGRRIPSLSQVAFELSAWETTRNASQKGVDWHFATDDARTKLKRLDPQVKDGWSTRFP